MSDALAITRDRIDRLLTALACASVDQMDAPECAITPQAEDDFGVLEGAFSLFLDELTQAKAEARRLNESQQETIRALSTPILDVWDGVLALPVIGEIDAQRASAMTEALLTRISRSSAHSVIVDLTGVDAIDDATTGHLAQLARAAELLGVRCILTGIRPEVAATVVLTGLDFGHTRTMRTLAEALEQCIRD